MTRGPAVSAFTRTHGEYEISDDPARLDLDVIERLLHATYWAWERPRAVMEKSIALTVVAAIVVFAGAYAFSVSKSQGKGK